MQESGVVIPQDVSGSSAPSAPTVSFIEERKAMPAASLRRLEDSSEKVKRIRLLDVIQISDLLLPLKFVAFIIIMCCIVASVAPWGFWMWQSSPRQFCRAELTPAQWKQALELPVGTNFPVKIVLDNDEMHLLSSTYLLPTSLIRANQTMQCQGFQQLAGWLNGKAPELRVEILGGDSAYEQSIATNICVVLISTVFAVALYVMIVFCYDLLVSNSNNQFVEQVQEGKLSTRVLVWIVRPWLLLWGERFPREIPLINEWDSRINHNTVYLFSNGKIQ